MVKKATGGGKKSALLPTAGQHVWTIQTPTVRGQSNPPTYYVTGMRLLIDGPRKPGKIALCNCGDTSLTPRYRLTSDVVLELPPGAIASTFDDVFGRNGKAATEGAIHPARIVRPIESLDEVDDYSDF
jgi:hypothetical protein